MPKEDGGIRGQCEMATQLEEKSCINVFGLHFGLDWFGEFFVVLRAAISLEKNNEKARQHS